MIGPLRRAGLVLTAVVTALVIGDGAWGATTPGPAATITPSTSGPVAVAAVVDWAAPPPVDMRTEVVSMDGAVTDLGLGNRAFRLNSDVLFDFDKATLKPRAVKEIARIAGLLKAQAPGEQAARSAKVTGHTDSVGSDPYNLGLSQRRAQAVSAALQAQLGSGVTVTAKGLGETTPIASNKTATGRTKNRRVEIIAA